MVDLFFPADELEIPLLPLVSAAQGVDLPLLRWGYREKGRRENRGSWHHYVDDYRFQGQWKEPDRLISTGAASAVEVNYSLFAQSPFPVALWATYRKRWLSRYWWVTAGVRCWVDLNVAPEWQELNLRGVPAGWPAFATRGYSYRLDDLEREFQAGRNRWLGTDLAPPAKIMPSSDTGSSDAGSGEGTAQCVEGLAQPHNSAAPAEMNFLVVNGGPAVREWCLERGAIYVEDGKDG